MDLIKIEGSELAIIGKSSWPNMFIFPKELRDTIPDYGGRALVFDRVHGSTNNFPATLAGLSGTMPFETCSRAQVQMIVHETGKLDGRFTLLMDLDSMAARSLGKFLLDLADQADAKVK